ncbi:uncharacterized protein DUF1648, partial [Muricomes intestini]
MKKIDAKLIALTTIICMLPMVAGIALYKDLPDVMTTHWTFGEKADGWMPKSAAVFLMPVLMGSVINFVSLVINGSNLERIKYEYSYQRGAYY